MPDAPPPDASTTRPEGAPIVWHDHGERVFVRIVCGECGARSTVIDLGPRFELAAVPFNGAVDVVARRVELAFGLSLVAHHLSRARAVG
jgi:hypothetical protein